MLYENCVERNVNIINNDIALISGHILSQC